jgi:uncharacterized protein (DUF58 family)
MLSARGVAVFCAGLSMWLTARVLGSAGLEVVGIGLAILPLLAVSFARWNRTRLSVHRRLSDVRVAPGTRLSAEIQLRNRSAAPTSFLLIEDRLPPALGRPARLVVSGIGPKASRDVRYTIVPQTRGRYRLGPLSIELADPFSLTRQRIVFDDLDELVVTPEVEDLSRSPDPATGGTFGASRATQLFRTGEEFYTMRPYHEGDDLRRIHWPSVARTGALMIRQDETSRRASGLVFLDSRMQAIGQTHTPAFERAVSAAASVGFLLANNGFSLRLATADTPPAVLSLDRFLDALAGVSHAGARSIGPALVNLRTGASPDTTLVLVAAPPAPTELATLIRAGAGFGPKLALLVHPFDPSTLPPERQAQLEGRATQARLAMTRGGWDCLVLSPSGSLVERWHAPRDRVLASSV